MGGGTKWVLCEGTNVFTKHVRGSDAGGVEHPRAKAQASLQPLSPTVPVKFGLRRTSDETRTRCSAE